MQSWHKKCARTQASSRPDELEASNELRVKWLAAPIKKTRKMIDTCSWNLANYDLSPGTSKHLAALASTCKHCTASTSPHLTPPHLTSLHLTCQHLPAPRHTSPHCYHFDQTYHRTRIYCLETENFIIMEISHLWR